jgi:hypothetical protein
VTEGTPPPLRPVGIGEVVDRTVRIFLASPALFILLATLPYIVLAIVNAIVDLAFVDIAETARNPVVLLAGQGVGLDRFFRPEVLARVAEFYALVALASVIVLSVQAAALVNAMAKRYLERPMTLAESLRSGFGAGVRLVPAGIIALAAVALLGAVAATVVAIASAAFHNPVPAIVGAIGIFVLICYVVVSWLPLAVVVTLEGRGPIDGLRRTWQLAGGARRRILGLLIVTSILQGILGLVFDLIVGTIAIAGQPWIVLQEVANFAVNAIWAPINWGAFTLLYYDLRVRKEAFGVELATGSD